MDYEIRDIMSSELDETTGTITYSLGDAVNSRTISTDALPFQEIGFVSRPANVLEDKTDAPQAFSISTTDEDIVIGARDVRGQKLYRNIAPGETCLYASGTTGEGQALVYLKDDSSINLYTVSNRDGVERKGMGVFINPNKDAISIVNSQGYGIMIDSNGVSIIGKDGNGINVGAATKINSLKVSNIEASDVAIGSTLQVNGTTVMNALTATVTTLGTTTTGDLKAIKISGAAVLGTSALAGTTGSVPGSVAIASGALLMV